jgi:hypothetical protein
MSVIYRQVHAYENIILFGIPTYYGILIIIESVQYEFLQGNRISVGFPKFRQINPLCRNAPQCALLIFTCLTPDDFTRQWGSSTVA